MTQQDQDCPAQGGPQQGGDGGGTSSWAQRGRTGNYHPDDQQQVEMAMRKHGQTTDATQRAARVSIAEEVWQHCSM